jgi:hypothetical protein
VQVSTSFSDLQEFGSKIIGPHIATERPSAPVRPYAPGMRKNLKKQHAQIWATDAPSRELTLKFEAKQTEQHSASGIYSVVIHTLA